MISTKTIGILGGMGPQASCELYRLINQLSCGYGRITRNSDFPHILINSLPVPDLIASENEKRQAISMVNQGALALARAGATDIFMSCNTMHAYQKEIVRGLNAKFHSLIDIVAEVAAHRARKVLILGSNTTLAEGLYQNALARRGVDYCVPDTRLVNDSVEIILATIAQCVTPELRQRFVGRVHEAAAKDPAIDTILLGCTELPLVFPLELGHFRILSSLHVMAHRILDIHAEGGSMQLEKQLEVS